MKDTILITGASSGIGYEMAVLLASQKFDLVLVARQSEKLQQIKTKLEQDLGDRVRTGGVEFTILRTVHGR